ncbi:hypothetical protein C2E23DRAFT_890315 [Lenzites betulinus]|nr:hypothetical protein C2E23DRAFT_890315 [Lenzites betulinus]
MTIEAKQYFLFLREYTDETTLDTFRRRSEGFPDESDTVTYTNRTRLVIISTINDVFQAGVNDSFPLLPLLLAPSSSGLYHYDITRAILDTQALMIWNRLTPPQRRRRRAQYVVYFHVPSQAPHAALNLAYFLLRFTYTAIRSYVTTHYDYEVHRQPQITNLAYHLRPSAADGVAFFNFLDDVYNNAATDALSYPHYITNGLRGLPVTTWPPHHSDLLGEQYVAECFARAS